jgi:hypothetical protein
MKRLLLVAVFALLPAALLAQVADRDVLLTPSGTLYTIESVANGDANRALALTTLQDGKSSVSIVPETKAAGANWRPTLTYDAESNTLFVFWIFTSNGLSSEMMFTSYRDGKWQPAVVFDERAYNLCTNLRIAVTRKVSTKQPDGTFSDAPALLVHAVWWEVVGSTEHARYALLTIENSRVKDSEVHDLSEFEIVPVMPFIVGESFNSEILRHPAIIGGTNSVDVLFGDTERLSMNRVTLKPIADGRVHIPVGHKGGPPFAPPQSFSASWSGRISTIGSGSNLIMYNISKDSAGYVMFSNGKWSDVHTLPLSDNFSGDAATAAISRMLASQ